jgi:hypothetical protein
MNRYYEIADASNHGAAEVRPIEQPEFEMATGGRPPQFDATIRDPLKSEPGDAWIRRALGQRSASHLAHARVVWRYSEETGIGEGWIIAEKPG